MGAKMDVLVANRRTWNEAWAGIISPLMSCWGKDLQLVVCDDASGAEEVLQLHKWLPKSAELLVNTEWRGVAKTFNRLLSVSTAECRLLINSDCVVRRLDEIDKLRLVMEKSCGEALVGTAEGPRFVDLVAAPYTVAQADSGGCAVFQGYVSGCVLMMPGRGEISELRFEEDWSRAYYEDTDLSYRARSNGWATLWVDTAIEHIGQVALSRETAALAAGSFSVGPEMWKATAKKRFLERWGPFLRPRRSTYVEAVRDYEEVNEALEREGSRWLHGSDVL